jgi:hypothetical protein
MKNGTNNPVKQKNEVVGILKVDRQIIFDTCPKRQKVED